MAVADTRGSKLYLHPEKSVPIDRYTMSAHVGVIAYIVGSVDEMTVSGVLQIGVYWVMRPEDDCTEPPRQLACCVVTPCSFSQPGESNTSA